MGALIQTVGPPAVAFVLAGGFATIELLTTRYRHTYFLLLPPFRCWALYIYAFMYATVGLALALVLTYLIQARVLRVEGLGLDQSWLRALYVGVATKGFLQFSVVSIGEERIGPATIMKAFEPAILHAITIDEDNLVKNYLDPYAQRYPVVADVRKRILDDVPANMPKQERQAFEMDISTTTLGGQDESRRRRRIRLRWER